MQTNTEQQEAKTELEAAKESAYFNASIIIEGLYELKDAERLSNLAKWARLRHQQLSPKEYKRRLLWQSIWRGLVLFAIAASVATAVTVIL